MIESKVIAVDFDDTVVKQRLEYVYPEIGPDVPRAVMVLKALVAQGHRIVLWTVRDSNRQNGLEMAVKWYEDRGIPLFGINTRPYDEQDASSSSPKVRANLYIDDAALGCPLSYEKDFRPYADWQAIEMILVSKGYLSA